MLTYVNPIYRHVVCSIGQTYSPINRQYQQSAWSSPSLSSLHARIPAPDFLSSIIASSCRCLSSLHLYDIPPQIYQPLLSPSSSSSSSYTFPLLQHLALDTIDTRTETRHLWLWITAMEQLQTLRITVLPMNINHNGDWNLFRVLHHLHTIDISSLFRTSSAAATSPTSTLTLLPKYQPADYYNTFRYLADHHSLRMIDNRSASSWLHAALPLLPSTSS
jgi:hypothetical protein